MERVKVERVWVATRRGEFDDEALVGCSKEKRRLRVARHSCFGTNDVVADKVWDWGRPPVAPG
jgi:hypothetical protein